MGVTSIEWADAVWNPVRGCTRVSEGCRNCYAERMAASVARLGKSGSGIAGEAWFGPARLGKSGSGIAGEAWLIVAATVIIGQAAIIVVMAKAE